MGWLFRLRDRSYLLNYLDFIDLVATSVPFFAKTTFFWLIQNTLRFPIHAVLIRGRAEILVPIYIVRIILHLEITLLRLFKLYFTSWDLASYVSLLDFSNSFARVEGSTHLYYLITLG